MLIPKTFKLAGIPVSVVIDNTFAKETNMAGQSVYSEQKIILDGKAMPRESTEAAFLHELVHWILFIMNRHELRNDEEFVDLFAHFLYQYMESALYEEEQ